LKLRDTSDARPTSGSRRRGNRGLAGKLRLAHSVLEFVFAFLAAVRGSWRSRQDTALEILAAPAARRTQAKTAAPTVESDGSVVLDCHATCLVALG